MAIDFDKWNAEFGGDAAVKETKEAAANAFREVADGDYVCKLEKLELGESKNGKPMVKGMFRIVEGEFKKQCLFYNGVMAANDPSKSGFCIHNVLSFLRSLDVLEEHDIDFDGNFLHFNDLLLDIAEESESLSFKVHKKQDGDFSRIEVVETYEN